MTRLTALLLALLVPAQSAWAAKPVRLNLRAPVPKFHAPSVFLGKPLPFVGPSLLAPRRSPKPADLVIRPVPAAPPVAPADSSHWPADLLPDRAYVPVLEEAKARLYPDPAEDNLRPAVLKEMARKDPAILSHMMRVGLIAGALALAIGEPLESARRMVWCGRLHDVGKMVPEIHAVISKPGKFTDEERAVMQRHPEAGAEIILAQTDLPADVQASAVKAALSHHEDYDGGRGFPRGIAGDAIPLEGRIVMAADVMDALLEHRPYHQGRTVAEALDVMEKMKGKFDPRLFAALKNLFRAN